MGLLGVLWAVWRPWFSLGACCGVLVLVRPRNARDKPVPPVSSLRRSDLCLVAMVFEERCSVLLFVMLFREISFAFVCWVDKRWAAPTDIWNPSLNRREYSQFTDSYVWYGHISTYMCSVEINMCQVESIVWRAGMNSYAWFCDWNETIVNRWDFKWKCDARHR